MSLTVLTKDVLLREAERAIPQSGLAWILVDSPEFVGLGAVGRHEVVLPPSFREDFWTLVEDVRVFSPIGEWHAWKLGPGVWGSRFRGATQVTSLVEEHWMWGKRVVASEPGVCELEEPGRGLRFSVPERVIRFCASDSAKFAAGPIQNADLPLRIVVEQVVERPGGSDASPGLARIVDALLVSILTVSGERIEPALGTNA